MARSAGRLSATSDVGEAVGESDVTFVVVPTPSGPDGTFSLQYVLNAAESIGACLAEQTGLSPGGDFEHRDAGLDGRRGAAAAGGDLREEVRPDFGLCYNPEFIALGSVIRDMSNPGHDADRRVRCARGVDAGGSVSHGVPESSAGGADEFRERGADQDLGEHVRHDQDFLCQHAGRSLREGAGRGLRR